MIESSDLCTQLHRALRLTRRYQVLITIFIIDIRLQTIATKF